MRFGSPRKLEAFCEREYGRDVVESFHRCSSGLLDVRGKSESAGEHE